MPSALTWFIVALGPSSPGGFLDGCDVLVLRHRAVDLAGEVGDPSGLGGHRGCGAREALAKALDRRLPARIHDLGTVLGHLIGRDLRDFS